MNISIPTLAIALPVSSPLSAPPATPSDLHKIARNIDLDHLSPHVRFLFDKWQRIYDGCERIYEEKPGITKSTEEANFDHQTRAGRRIAEYKPKTIHDAASLLACVFLDEHTDAAWGLCWVEQLKVLANVKAFLLSQNSPGDNDGAARGTA